MADDSKTHTPGEWRMEAEELRGGRYFSVYRGASGFEAIDLHESENGEADGRLIAAAPNMAGALADLLQMFAQPGESSNDRFERLAEAFYRDTGIMAPGKDVPAAMVDCMTHEDRRERWDAWVSAKIVRAYVALSAATGKEG